MGMQLSGSLELTGSFTTSGAIVAQTLIVQTITSSITQMTGSNVFGSITSNVQQMTGSLRVTGSGNHYILGGSVGVGTNVPSFSLDVYASSNNQGIRVNSVQAAALYLYSTYNSANNRNWGLYTNSQVFGDFDIRQSNISGSDMTVGANSTSRLYISSSGNIGIGTVTPSAKLNLIGGELRWGYTSDLGALSYTDNKPMLASVGATDFLFYTNAAERMRITSGGDVGIGTLSIYYASTNRRVLEINGTSSSFLAFKTGDVAKSYLFQNGTDFIITNLAAAGGYLALENGGAERMRITSGGQVFVRTTSQLTPGGVAGVTNLLNPNNDGIWALAVQNNATTNSYGRGIGIRIDTVFNNTSNEMLYCADSLNSRFYVMSNGGVYNYQANNVNLSDINTKKDIHPLESYWDKFKAIEIVKFKYKDQTHDDFNIGVIAQQVEEHAPEFIDTSMQQINGEEVETKAVYTSDLHHATIKVLQEAMAKIETLEARVKELENK